jgi:flagellar biosynthesis/type III secretory pathway protein FliH
MYLSKIVKSSAVNTVRFYDFPEFSQVKHNESLEAYDFQTSETDYETSLVNVNYDNDTLSARREAQRILKEAHEKAEAIVSDANRKAQEIYTSNLNRSKKEGYFEGIEQAKQEFSQRIEELAENLGRISDCLVAEREELINSSKILIIDLAAEIARRIVCDNFMDGDKFAFLDVFQNAVKDIPPAEKLIVTISEKDYKLKTFNAEKLKACVPELKTLKSEAKGTLSRVH